MSGIGFDLISDLNLTADDKFTWEGKVTSLCCVVSGNLSSDLKVLQKTLTYLSTLYQGVFYIDGFTEQQAIPYKDDTVAKISKICSSINNTIYLHNNVVILNGVAIIGANTWFAKPHEEIPVFDRLRVSSFRNEDLVYLGTTIKKMQVHKEVNKILVVSASPPNKELFFKDDEHITDNMDPTICLEYDTEGKISHWVFGGTDKKIDTVLNGVNYISNPCSPDEPYWAKRIQVNY